MTKSRHSEWMTVVAGKQRIFRKKGDQYDVLEFRRYPYTTIQTDKVSKLIRLSLTDDLLSKDIREKYPEDHPRWKYPFFGHCVPATFVLMYLMDTGTLEPIRGEDTSGEGHWWLRDILTREKYDLTLDQFPTYGDLEDVYATGKPRGYYGVGEMPASQFFDLIQIVQPDSKRWITDDYTRSSASLETS